MRFIPVLLALGAGAVLTGAAVAGEDTGVGHLDPDVYGWSGAVAPVTYERVG